MLNSVNIRIERMVIDCILAKFVDFCRKIANRKQISSVAAKMATANEALRTCAFVKDEILANKIEASRNKECLVAGKLDCDFHDH